MNPIRIKEIIRNMIIILLKLTPYLGVDYFSDYKFDFLPLIDRFFTREPLLFDKCAYLLDWFSSCIKSSYYFYSFRSISYIFFRPWSLSSFRRLISLFFWVFYSELAGWFYRLAYFYYFIVILFYTALRFNGEV